MQSNPQWNYEPCVASHGTVIVGKSERPTWWCADLEGTRRKCIRVESAGQSFYIDDEDGSGTAKVFAYGGGPDSPHKSLPVDQPTSFIPDPGYRVLVVDRPLDELPPTLLQEIREAEEEGVKILYRKGPMTIQLTSTNSLDHMRLTDLMLRRQRKTERPWFATPAKKKNRRKWKR